MTPNMKPLSEVRDEWISERQGLPIIEGHEGEYYTDRCFKIGFDVGVEEMKKRASVLVDALKCNETFHRLGGIDDCDPCKALKQYKKNTE